MAHVETCQNDNAQVGQRIPFTLVESGAARRRMSGEYSSDALTEHQCDCDTSNTMPSHSSTGTRSQGVACDRERRTR